MNETGIILSQLTDQQVVDLFLELLTTGRIELRVGFESKDGSDILTHTAMHFKAGSITGYSLPDELDQPLLLVK